MPSPRTVTIFRLMSAAFYPGSFDPPTCAHLDLARRARAVFGSLTVGIGRNSRKSPVLSEEDRLELLRDELAGEGAPGDGMRIVRQDCG